MAKDPTATRAAASVPASAGNDAVVQSLTGEGQERARNADLPARRCLGRTAGQPRCASSKSRSRSSFIHPPVSAAGPFAKERALARRAVARVARPLDAARRPLARLVSRSAVLSRFPTSGEAAMMSLFALSTLTSLWEQDVWWQVRAGSVLLDLPASSFLNGLVGLAGSGWQEEDAWSYTVPGVEWRNAQWLATLPLALAHRWGGVPALVVLRACCAALLYFLLSRCVDAAPARLRRRDGYGEGRAVATCWRAAGPDRGRGAKEGLGPAPLTATSIPVRPGPTFCPLLLPHPPPLMFLSPSAMVALSHRIQLRSELAVILACAWVVCEVTVGGTVQAELEEAATRARQAVLAAEAEAEAAASSGPVPPPRGGKSARLLQRALSSQKAAAVAPPRAATTPTPVVDERKEARETEKGSPLLSCAHLSRPPPILRRPTPSLSQAALQRTWPARLGLPRAWRRALRGSRWNDPPPLRVLVLLCSFCCLVANLHFGLVPFSLAVACALWGSETGLAGRPLSLVGGGVALALSSLACPHPWYGLKYVAHHVFYFKDKLLTNPDHVRLTWRLAVRDPSLAATLAMAALLSLVLSDGAAALDRESVGGRWSAETATVRARFASAGTAAARIEAENQARENNGLAAARFSDESHSYA